MVRQPGLVSVLPQRRPSPRTTESLSPMHEAQLNEARRWPLCVRAAGWTGNGAVPTAGFEVLLRTPDVANCRLATASRAYERGWRSRRLLVVLGSSLAIANGDSVSIVHNTLGAGATTGGKAQVVGGCVYGCSLVNNILFVYSGTTRSGITSVSIGNETVTVRSNAFAGIPNTIYSSIPAGTHDLAGLLGLDGTEVPYPNGCTSGVDCDTFSTDGNLDLGALLDNVFVDWNGPDQLCLSRLV